MKVGNKEMDGPKILDHAMSMLLLLVVVTVSSNGADGMVDGTKPPAWPKELTLTATDLVPTQVSCMLSTVLVEFIPITENFEIKKS